MLQSRRNSAARVLPLIALLLFLSPDISGAITTEGADSLVVNTTRSPADLRSRLFFCYGDTTVLGVNYQLQEEYSRFHNLTTTRLKQENRQQLTLARPLFTGVSLLLNQHSEFYHEQNGRQLFDGTLLSGSRMQWRQLQLDLAGGAVSRLRDEAHSLGPALQIEAEQSGPLNTQLLLVMENPAGYRERQALVTTNGHFTINERVRDQLGVTVTYDQSTQDWLQATSVRRDLQEQARNNLAYRVNSHTTVYAISSLQFNRLEQGGDNHHRLGWGQELRHHYLYQGVQLRTSFSLQRSTAEALLNAERRFSEIGRNLFKLEMDLPLWFSDTLQLTGMIDRLRHDTDLYGSGSLQNEITGRDYRDERLLRSSLRHGIHWNHWSNDFSLIFRSRELNYIFANQSGNNHDAVNLVVGERVNYRLLPGLLLSGGLELISAWRHYHFETAADPRSYIDRGFHGDLSCSYTAGQGDTLHCFVSTSYEDGGLYNYGDHIEFRSHSADEERFGFSWRRPGRGEWWWRVWLHYLQRSDWDYNTASASDRILRRRLQQLNSRVELARADNLTLQTGAVYSWGEQVTARLDLVYQLNWQISF